MARESTTELKELAGICRRLAAARQRVSELEAQRDALIAALRHQGVAGSVLAARTGLSPGRVTQIAGNGRADAPVAS